MEIPFVGNFGLGAGFWSSFGKILIWGAPIGGLIIVAALLIRNKIKYKYYGVIYRRRQETFDGNMPASTIVKGKAGYFKKRNGKDIFRIKWGIMPWHVTELTKLPDPKYMIGNEVYYLQLQKDNLVQARIDVDWEGGFNLTPVEDDMVYGAMLDIYDKEKILDMKKLTPITIGFIVMGLVLVSGIVVFYFLSKA